MKRFPQGRPRKLSKFQERVLIEEVRMGQYFSRKRIAARHKIHPNSLNEYIRRATAEDRL